MSGTREQILATLAWANAFGMALSSFEVWKWLVAYPRTRNSGAVKMSLSEVVEKLDVLVAEDRVGTQWGFYFLTDREALVEQRAWRLKITNEKWKKLVSIVRWMRLVPFLRAVFASGSLAINNTKEESDLDVFLVTAPGRIFTARLFLIAVLKILGKYRGGAHVANYICPNHYVTETSLEIPFRSLYTAHLYSTFVRVWSKDSGALDKFWNANSWIGEYLELSAGMLGIHNAPRRTLKDPILVKTIRGAVETILHTPLGDVLERIARKVQLAHIEANPLTKNPGQGHVVVNDQMLAFHPNSPEQGMLDKYKKSMLSLGLSEQEF